MENITVNSILLGYLEKIDVEAIFKSDSVNKVSPKLKLLYLIGEGYETGVSDEDTKLILNFIDIAENTMKSILEEGEVITAPILECLAFQKPISEKLYDKYFSLLNTDIKEF